MAKYSVIVADLPWFYNQRPTHQQKHSKTKFGGGASGTYQLMKDEDIYKLGPLIQEVTTDYCAMFMWATMPKLDVALECMKQWGFEYKTTAFVWIKTNQDGVTPSTSPGFYTASNAEIVLLGTKQPKKRKPGEYNPLTPHERLINSVVIAPRSKHSEKPEEVQNRIERMYPVINEQAHVYNYLELFARRERDNWACLGNEIDGRDIREALQSLAEL